MTNKNQFWKGMLLGAIAGGVISLLDKDTREIMKGKVQTTASKVSYIVRNPGEITEKVKETATKIKSTAQQVSEDIAYITNKVEEIQELTPQMKGIIKETKDSFSKSDEMELLEEVLGEEKILN